MPKQEALISPFSDIYAGDWQSVGPLTLIQSDTTGGVKVQWSIPSETFHEAAGGSLPDGRQQVVVSGVFVYPNTQLVNLALGNLPTNTGFDDTPTQFRNLSLLLVHPDGADNNRSIWIPKCYVQKTLGLDQSKTNPTVIAIQFVAYNRDFSQRIFYRRPHSDLASAMGGQYPL